jgi:hypothetical protein
MKYQIRTYDTSTNVVNVAICGDTDDIEQARLWSVSLLFMSTTEDFETQVSNLWSFYQIEQAARDNISTEVIGHILNNAGTAVELADPPMAQSSHSTAVDSTGTTGVEVL